MQNKEKRGEGKKRERKEREKRGNKKGKKGNTRGLKEKRKTDKTVGPKEGKRRGLVFSWGALSMCSSSWKPHFQMGKNEVGSSVFGLGSIKRRQPATEKELQQKSVEKKGEKKEKKAGRARGEKGN